MQEQDAVLADIIREMREERGRRGGFDDSRLRERVEVLGPEVSLDVLRDAVTTALVDRLGVTWDERYGELKRYKDRFGDCSVSVYGEYCQLGGWVSQQRGLNNRGRLSDFRKARLDELGFVWDARASKWETMFAELRRYKDRTGDCNVPAVWSENPKLGQWIRFQRGVNEAGKLSSARRARLDELGFVWDAHNSDLGGHVNRVRSLQSSAQTLQCPPFM